MAALALQSDLGDDVRGLASAEAGDDEDVPRTPPPKKRRGKGTRKSGKKPPNPKHRPATLKCRDCNKVKPSAEFYEDQRVCKICNSGKRALLTTASAQGCREAAQAFAKKNPEAFDSMQKAHNKARAEQAREQGKVKFSCAVFMREWEKREGFRDAQLGEYMWEQEFYEFAAGAKMGFLSKPEREQRWLDMKAEEWRPRDHEGPRGFLRLWVKTKDQAELYNDVSSAKRLQLQELARKPSEKHVQSRVQMAFGDTVDDKLDANVDFAGVKSEAMKASGTGGNMAGLMMPLVSDLMETASAQCAFKSKGRSARAQKKKGSDAEESDDDDDEATDEEEESENESSQSSEGARGEKRKAGKMSKKAKGSGKGQASWYDAETQNLKAERAFGSSIETLKGQMVEVADSMSKAVTEFRSVPTDAQACLCSSTLNLKLSHMCPKDQFKVFAHVPQTSPD